MSRLEVTQFYQIPGETTIKDRALPSPADGHMGGGVERFLSSIWLMSIRIRMSSVIGIPVDVLIGEASDGALVGMVAHGIIVSTSAPASGIEFADVELEEPLTYKVRQLTSTASAVRVVPRHVGHGLGRLLFRPWREKITVFVMPIDDSPEDDGTATWETIRKDTVAIAELVRRRS